MGYVPAFHQPSHNNFCSSLPVDISIGTMKKLFGNFLRPFFNEGSCSFYLLLLPLLGLVLLTFCMHALAACT